MRERATGHNRIFRGGRSASAPGDRPDVSLERGGEAHAAIEARVRLGKTLLLASPRAGASGGCSGDVEAAEVTAGWKPVGIHPRDLCRVRAPVEVYEEPLQGRSRPLGQAFD